MMQSLECPACSGRRWKQLPGWSSTAMLSDGRRIVKPLEKQHCISCGLARHAVLPSQEEVECIFASDYELFSRLSGSHYEEHRQSLYADWILRLIRGRPANSLFEVGAGIGSLMAQFRRRLPIMKLSGIEPVQSAVDGRLESFDIRRCLLREMDRSAVRADVVLSVNVIEHVDDPVAFTRQSAEAVGPGGCLVMICPNGDIPSSELLLYDHFHSFTEQAIQLLARRAGLTVAHLERAPVELGPFHAIVLERGGVGLPDPAEHDGRLYESRRLFLSAWQSLDERLQVRQSEFEGDLWAFGNGENAQLLRAYAPIIWNKVRGILSDVPGEFGDLEVSIYAPTTSARRTVLLAVKPESQPALAARLSLHGDIPIRWDEFIQSKR